MIKMFKVYFINPSTYKKHIIAAVIVTTLLATSLTIVGTYYIYNQAISNSGTTYGPEDVDAYSYVIYKEDSTYYAKDGTTRAIAYSGTNASYVFNTLIKSLESIGGKIFVQAGSYAISTSIEFEGCHNIVLEGEGVRTTLYASSDVDVIRVVGTTEETIADNEIRKLKVQGYYDTNPSTTKSGIGVRYTVNTKIVGVWVHKCNHGIYLYSTDNYRALVQDCRCWDNDDDGIADTGGYYTIITNNHLFSNGDCGVHLVKGKDRIVSGNHVWSNGVGGGDAKHGIALENVDNSTFYGNIITDNENDGIILSGSRGNTIESNILKDNKRAGILFLRSNDNVIEGNQIIDNGNASETYRDGICITSDSDGNTVMGNIIAQSGRWGLYISSDSDYNVVIGVDCRDNTDGIVDSGSNNHINLCWNGTNWIS